MISPNKKEVAVIEPKNNGLNEEVISPSSDNFNESADKEILLKTSAEELTLSQPVTDSEPQVTSEESQDVVEEAKPVTRKGRKKRFIFAFVFILLAVAIAVTIYMRRETGKPVPVPTNVDHTTHQETGTGTGDGQNKLPENAFKISAEKQQLIGVQYGTVEQQQVAKTLRAVGRVAYDETKLTRVNLKVEGWIENVYVDFIGKEVKKGQPLISIYSPELVQTQQEYLLAIKGRKELSDSPFNEAVRFSESLVESARRRLELWDISEKQIKELEERGTPLKALTLYSPASGFVLTRNAYPKQRVTPETELYSFADLSKVWVVADIYEFEASDIKLGQKVVVTTNSYPGRSFAGQISYIYPQVESSTRTLKVRVELANPGFILKPDMYADVTINMTYGSRLVVPQEAVMDSGSEQTVFVSLGDGYFEPRKVELGGKADNKYIVLNGLRAGERVVTSGNFLIDSESKLKSAAGGLGMPGMDHGGGQEKKK